MVKKNKNKKRKSKRTTRGELYVAHSLYPYIIYDEASNIQELKFGDKVEAQQSFNPGQYVYIIDEGGEDELEDKEGSNNIYFKVVGSENEAKQLKEKFDDGEYYSYQKAKEWTMENPKGVY